jgi:hypothetical protein
MLYRRGNEVIRRKSSEDAVKRKMQSSVDAVK